MQRLRPRMAAATICLLLCGASGYAFDGGAPAQAPVASGAAEIDADRPILRSRQKAAAPAAGANAPTQGEAAEHTWVRTTAALGGVVGLIGLLAWGYRVVAGASGGFALTSRTRRPGLIEVLSRTALSPRQSVCLVRVGPRLVLVGVSADRLQALDVIADEELAARMIGENAGARGDSSQAVFRSCLDNESASYESADADDELDESLTPDDVKLAHLRQELGDALARLRARSGQESQDRRSVS